MLTPGVNTKENSCLSQNCTHIRSYSSSQVSQQPVTANVSAIYEGRLLGLDVVPQVRCPPFNSFLTATSHFSILVL